MKKCEMIGCQNTGTKMYRLGPATTGLLFTKCIGALKHENVTGVRQRGSLGPS